MKFGDHTDGDKDHTCDYGCKETIGTCEDKNTDHKCDYGCGAKFGEHVDSDKNHICDYGCKETIGTCEDKNTDHKCDYGCDRYFGIHKDSSDDADHVCDYGCGVVLEECVDGEDNNHNCDICDKVDVSEHVWEDATCLLPKTCKICAKTDGEELGHNYESVVTDPTCEADGYTTYTCTRCDDTYVSDEVDALGHIWNAGEITKMPTCEEDGIKKFTCTRNEEHTMEQTIVAQHFDGNFDGTCDICEKVICKHGVYDTINVVEATCKNQGYTGDKECKICHVIFEYGTTIQKLEHVWGDGVVTEPTCKEQGYTTSTCSKCGETRTENYVPAKAHTEVELPAVDATCDNTGLTAGVKCSVCGTELTKQEVIPALGHKMKLESAKVEPKCEVAGKEAVYTCANGCGKIEGGEEIAALEHNMEETSAKVEPKCEEAGKTAVYTCANGCDKTTGGEEIAALEHDMKETSAKVEPKCEVAGKTAVYTCANGCGKTEGGEEIKALEHKMVETSAKVEPKCEEAGKEAVYTCANGCGKTEGGEVIAALEHNMTETSAKIEPKCEVAGKEAVYTCANGCGKTEGGETIAALEHKMQKTSDKIEPKCEVAGKEAVYTCANTGCDKTTGGEVIAALTHNFAADFTVDAKATCTTAGSKSKHCSRCAAVTDTTVIPAREHVLVDNGVAQAATCTETGIMNQKCSNNETLEYDACKYVATRVIPATGHKEELVPAKAATCSETGLTAGKKCSVCKDVLVAQTTIGALGHDYNEGVVTTDPTCTEKGIKTFTCKNDTTHTYTEEVPATNHINGTPVKEGEIPATCTADGSYKNVVYCTKCEKKVSEEVVTIPASGHDIKLMDSKAVTCTADGYETYSCQNNCGYGYTTTIATTGHKNSDVVIEDNIDATCSNAGSYNKVIYCTVCKEELSKEAVTVPALDHTIVIIEAVAVTCTKDGRTEGKYCSKCDTVMVESVVIPAPGHNKVEHEAKAPTCTEIGWDAYTTCTECDYTTYSEKSALNHDFAEDFTIDVAATCTTAGSKSRHCSRCSETTEVTVIPANGHTVGSRKYVAATCTTGGRSYSVCGECGVDFDFRDHEALGHNYNYSSEFTVTVEATCETSGAVYRKCTRCGEIEKDANGKDLAFKTIAAKGHYYFAYSEAVAPTCELPGTTAAKRCLDCGKEFAPELIPALGHKAGKDGQCENCDSLMFADGSACTCHCHKTSIIGKIVYKILRFFWKLFGIKQECACGGDAHY